MPEAAASVRAQQPGLRVDVLGDGGLEAHADAAAYALTSDAELRARGLFAAESLLAVRRLLRVRGGGGHCALGRATAAGARSHPSSATSPTRAACSSSRRPRRSRA